jgi:hypothetical protein
MPVPRASKSFPGWRRPSSPAGPPPESGWDRGFDAHAEGQRRRIAALPLWVRIEWLEETQRMLTHLRGGAKPPDPEESAGP